MKYPYYRKILEGLRGPLDPRAFEACAVALLQKDSYSTLVPVHGGQDDGMDGAIADGEGEAYPLIVTTAQDVLRNFTKNLEAYTAGGGTRDRVVVATSIDLTPKRRKNLQERAREKGFVLVQIHDQRDFADRLYRDSRWARELLGVTPEPAALSAVPRTRRPLREDVPLIGREADLAWLRETSGDRVIIGQPGAGKTYLLLQLVREGKALFLASEDEARIAADLRDLQPEIVIVDDAHLDPEKLVRLRQLREEIAPDPDLVATGWPGTEDELTDALALSSSKNLRRLELLTRKQIKEVLRGLGIQEPDDDPDLAALVEQAANKPGLAVILGSLWLRGERLEVLTGAAIKRSLLPALTRVLESDPTVLLACFALGGDAGLTMATVGEFLGHGREHMHRRVIGASQGGVLRVVDPREDRRLAVEPEALRSALLQEVFFPGPSQPGLPYRALLDRAGHPPQAVETLVVAALRQAPIPRNALRALVAEHGSRDSWCLLARLGEGEGRWVLENYTGRLSDIASYVLKSAPRAAIDRLLEEAVEASGPLHSQPSHPLRILQDWVQEIPFAPGRADRFFPDESLSRRKLIVEIACDWLDAGEDRENRVVAVRAALVALNPLLRSSRLVATGDAVTSRNVSLPAETISEILELWSRIGPHLPDVVEEVWAELSTLVDQWAHRSPGVSEEQLEEMQTVSRQMLLDLTESAANSPGLRSALKVWGSRVGLELDMPVDEDFEVLYPPEVFPLDSTEQLREEMERQEERARCLGRDWAHRPPEEVAARLAYLEEQAKIFRNLHTSSHWAFSQALAEKVFTPVDWAKCFLELGIMTDCVRFLVARAIREQCGGWEALLADCLRSEQYRSVAMDAVLRAGNVPEELVRDVLPHVPADLVWTVALQGRMPLATLRTFLKGGYEETAVAAAVGEWLADPKERVNPQVQAEWCRAILQFGAETEVERLPHPGLTHGLKAIFGASPELALRWLEARVRDAGEYEIPREYGVYKAAAQTLDTDQRARLLRGLEPSRLARSLIPWLVGDSPELFEVLLSRAALRRHHLEPLGGGPPGSTWAALAQRALDSGHDPERIAAAAYSRSGVFRGFGTEHWRGWQTAFGSLVETAEGRLREVARHGLKMAEERLSASEEWRRRFELTGRF